MRNHKLATVVITVWLLIGCAQHKTPAAEITDKNTHYEFFQNAGKQDGLIQAEADSIDKIIFQRKKF